MAVEVAGFEMVQGQVENGAEGDKSTSREKENGKLDQDSGVAEPIKFGSHGDESAKADGNGVSDSSVPSDAVEEWPAPKQIHSFYFVRCRPYDDPNIKSKVDKLDKEINQKNQARIKLTDALRAKRVSQEYFCHGCLIRFVLDFVLAVLICSFVSLSFPFIINVFLVMNLHLSYSVLNGDLSCPEF